MASKRPLRTVSVAEAATNELRDSLFAGEFKPGEEIKDTQIAEAYGIARPTARIAVQQLINEDMLVREPGYSARVRSFDEDQVRDIFRVRKLIELNAVHEAKESGRALDGVRAAMEGFAALGETQDWSRIAEADARFHRAVVDVGGSPRLSAYFEALTNEIRLLLALPAQHFGRGATPYEEHEELFLMMQGEASADDLEAAWALHLDESRDFLIERLASNHRAA